MHLVIPDSGGHCAQTSGCHIRFDFWDDRRLLWTPAVGLVKGGPVCALAALWVTDHHCLKLMPAWQKIVTGNGKSDPRLTWRCSCWKWRLYRACHVTSVWLPLCHDTQSSRLYSTPARGARLKKELRGRTPKQRRWLGLCVSEGYASTFSCNFFLTSVSVKTAFVMVQERVLGCSWPKPLLWGQCLWLRRRKEKQKVQIPDQPCRCCCGHGL